MFVHSISTNESSGKWVAVPGDGPSLLCENEEYVDQERVPLQVFRIQGKETSRDEAYREDVVEAQHKINLKAANMILDIQEKVPH